MTPIIMALFTRKMGELSTTTYGRAPRSPISIILRFAMLLLATSLCVQSGWLLLPELFRPGITELPTDSASAASATHQREASIRAAQIGVIRGELWAESAFTYSDLLWNTPNDSAALALQLQQARASLYRALSEAPEKSDAWLLLAGLGLRFPKFVQDATAALKMSYYTGPTDVHLMPLRLRIAAQADAFNDFEVRQFVTRDLQMFIAQHQEATIAEAYRVTSPTGKHFIEQAVSEIDPSALVWLQHAAP
jgi:hypothetical protein